MKGRATPPRAQPAAPGGPEKTHPPAAAPREPNPAWNALALRAPSRGHAPATGGQPLDEGSLAFFGRAFGRELGDVRVHAGPEADALARHSGANAYTTGHDIVFADGRFAPGTTAGRALLAHELTHVVQQERVPAAGSQAAPVVTRPGDAAERAAEAAARAVADGRPVPRDLLTAAPASRPTIARDRGNVPPAPPGTVEMRVDKVGDATIVSTLVYDTEHAGEIGPVEQKRLRHTRYVSVKTADGIEATLEMHGVSVFPYWTPDGDAATMLDVDGRGYVDYVVRGVVKRGAMPTWVGFDFAGIETSTFAPMRAVAGRGPRFMHFGLTPAEQIDSLLDEIRRRLPPPAKKHDTISQQDFTRLTPGEKAELAKEAIGDAVDLGNIGRGLLIALGFVLLGLAAIGAAVFGLPALAIGLLAAIVIAAVVGIVYLLKDAISDAIARWLDDDVLGAILSVAKVIAAVAAVVVGVVLVVGAVAAAIVGAPFVAAGLAFAAVALGVAAAVIGILQALNDYNNAKNSQDLKEFHKHTQRAARAIEGAITDGITTVVPIIIAKGQGVLGRSAPAAAPTPTQPAPLPALKPPGPTIIEPPQVAPAAPPIPEIPQVAPPAPVIPEVPQVAPPTVMVPHVTPPPPPPPKVPVTTTGPDWGIPAGGIPARARLGKKGVTVPDYATKNPDFYYYDPQTGKYNRRLGYPSDPGASHKIPCFPAGTAVATPVGPRAIETLAAGDVVFAWSEAERLVVVRRVVETHRQATTHLVRVACEGGATLVATRDHRIWVEPGAWTAAHELAPGDALRTLDGAGARVRTRDAVEVPEQPTYNLVVERDSNYFAGDGAILVHNDGDYSIYLGIDPKTNEVIYVGQTKQTLPARQSQHQSLGTDIGTTVPWKGDMRLSYARGPDGKLLTNLSLDEAFYWERKIYDRELAAGRKLLNAQVPYTDKKMQALDKKYC